MQGANGIEGGNRGVGSLRAHLLVGAAVGAVLAVMFGAPAWGAGSIVAHVARPTPVSAFGDRVAWSSFQPKTGRYALMTRVGGVTSRVPVAARRGGPFDVDLGRTRRGGTVAVYSRCEHERGFPLGKAQPAVPRGCDLYMFSFQTRHETRIPGASTRAASEYLPSVWEGSVAFARVYEGRKGRRGRYRRARLPYLYVRRLSGEGASVRQPGGTRGTTGAPGPIALDLSAKVLAFAWGRFESGGRYRSVIRVDRRSGRRHRSDVGTTRSRDGVGGLVSAPILADRVYAGEWSAPGSPRNRLFAAPIEASSTFLAPAPDLLTSVSVGRRGSHFYARAATVDAHGAQGCGDADRAGCVVGQAPIMFDSAVTP